MLAAVSLVMFTATIPAVDAGQVPQPVKFTFATVGQDSTTALRKRAIHVAAFGTFEDAAVQQTGMFALGHFDIVWRSGLATVEISFL